MESFHTTLKKEYVHSENLESLKTGIYEYIEIWYNNSRIHSKIGFTSPNEYEESIKKKMKKLLKKQSKFLGTLQLDVDKNWYKKGLKSIVNGLKIEMRFFD